ncbi:E3 ubiquitin-protein ligase TRIM7-like [Aquarana catesbeiana]|uniref:E3 ubiquitin-protein ligase TRIM7-like n=1 Tax=Aquarana catesbeiana TaxID=8400 RepID=UPI003CC9617B
MMAAAELKFEVTCSICTEIFTDPVTLICGHSFCQVCITRTFDNQHDREYFCPECMQDFRKRPELKKNPRLSNIANHFHSVEPKGDQPEKEHSKSPEHVLTDPNTSLEDRKCPVHKKILEYYCIDDDRCICAHCMTSDHRGHKVNTISEFLQQQTKNLKPILEILFAKREETEAMLQSLQNHKMKIDKEADGLDGKVNAIMKDIRMKQEDLEKRVLTEISRQQKQISLSVSNDIQQLENKKSKIEKKITQIEELSSNTNPISALQTAGVLLCVSMDECNLDTGMGKEMIHEAGDLDEHAILETLHSGLSNIVVGAGKEVHVKDVHKVSLSAADENIHLGSRRVYNEPQIEGPGFIHEPNAPVRSCTPLETQIRAIDNDMVNYIHDDIENNFNDDFEYEIKYI